MRSDLILWEAIARLGKGVVKAIEEYIARERQKDQQTV